MRRFPDPEKLPRWSIRKAISAFFLAENRLSVRWRLAAILAFALVFLVIGDLLDGTSHLSSLLVR